MCYGTYLFQVFILAGIIAHHLKRAKHSCLSFNPLQVENKIAFKAVLGPL